MRLSLLKFSVFSLLSLIIFSCSDNANTKALLPEAQGSFTDITIVVDPSIWEGAVGKSLQSTLREPIQGLFNLEYDFDLIDVKPKAFSSLFKKQRNIILVVIHEELEMETINYAKDVYATGQLVVKIEAKSVFNAVQLIEARKTGIQKAFHDKRNSEYQQKLFANRHKKHVDLLSKNHQISFLVPQGYQLADEQSNFIYFSKRGKATCDYGQNTNCYYQNGIFIYYYPYEDKDNFTYDFLKNKRDSITKEFIPGPDNDTARTYMEIEQKFLPFGTNSELNGKFCYEMKGWWNMVNATMGGPYVSISILDEENNRVITADAFTFAPNFNKRAFVYELEAIVRSLRPQ